MEDIISRLRGRSEWLLDEAADEIEQLRNILAELAMWVKIEHKIISINGGDVGPNERELLLRAQKASLGIKS